MTTCDRVPWEDLSASAKRTLRQIAHLYLDRGTYTVRLEIHGGGNRDARVETSMDALQSRRKRAG